VGGHEVEAEMSQEADRLFTAEQLSFIEGAVMEWLARRLAQSGCPDCFRLAELSEVAFLDPYQAAIGLRVLQKLEDIKLGY
jgi:hypothetical protein